MKKLLLLTSLFISTLSFAFADKEKEKKYTIVKSTNSYEYVYNKKENRVEVKEIQYTKYKAVKGGALPIGEQYNDNITIDEVKVKINGSKAKWIEPKYDYMSSDDIFFSDQRICYFTIPSLYKDEEVEITFEKTYLDTKYFTQAYFDENYDVATKEVIITVPKWMKMEAKEFNFAGNKITKTKEATKKDDADIYTYTAQNITAKEKEYRSPGPSYIYPHLLIMSKTATPAEGVSFTFFNTTADQYAWYRKLVSNIENDKTILKNKATEIVAGANNDLDKIKAIFYWVQNNIRYLAFEDGIAGFKPDKAHEVLRKKFGDCKGMAHLTKELLTSLGYDARLCWIGTNHIAYDYSTPSLSVDNHMICALNFQNKVYYLDATEKYIGLDEYAERIQGRQVMYENGEKYVIANVPSTTYKQNKEFEKRVLTIDGTTIKGTVSHEWNGEEKEYLLNQIHATKKENLKESFEKFLKSGNADYEMKDMETSDLQKFDKALTVKYNLNHKNGASSFGKELYLELDNRKDFAEFEIDTADRQNDYMHMFKYYVVHDYEVTLPAGGKATTLPQPFLIKNDDYEFNIAYATVGNKLTYKKTIIVNNIKLAKSKINQWNADVKKLKDFYSEQVVITTN